MKSKVFIKNAVSSIPYSIGKYFTYIPFSWRLGTEYTKSKNNIISFERISKDEQLNYVVTNLNKIVKYATNNFDFYHDFYREYGVLNKEIKYLDDFDKYPILTKEKIRTHTESFKGAMKINTGGTSGEPFSFYIDENAFAREWAYMHSIWELKGYDKSYIKITLRGKNLGKKNIVYNPVHNEFIINTYKSVASFKNELLELFSKHEIKYVHGYPSAIYEFFKDLESTVTKDEKIIIQKNIISCFFGSEFPMPNMTKYLADTWNLDYISWYGHSEMAILAYDEYKTNNYKPFMTYGYAEVINNKLIGTSYNNFDMPLIKYDTGDLVEGKLQENGLLDTFSVKEGREGDFIVDKNNKKIPLTALIFGRHHKIFDFADFLQVEQQSNNNIIFYITLKNSNNIDLLNLDSYFDLSNVDIDYSFKIITAPIRSKIGKMKLKINE
jgi:phenylacetate-CoA ligase